MNAIQNTPAGFAVNGAGEITIQALFYEPIDFGGGLLQPQTPFKCGVCGGGRNLGLAKFDASGNYLWSKVFPQTTDVVQSTGRIVDDGLGDTYLLGSTLGMYGGIALGGATLQECGSNLYLAKLDGTGNQVWSEILCSGGAQYALSVTVDHSHNLLFSGDNSGLFTFVGGQVASVGADGDALVAKVGPNGSVLWARDFGSTSPSPDSFGSNGVAVDPQDAVLIVGGGQGNIDFGGGSLVAVSKLSQAFVVKLDPSGNHVWSRGINNTQPNQGGVTAYGVASDSSGNVYVTGQYFDACDFGNGLVLPAASGKADLFFAKYDGLGNILWAKHFSSNQPGGFVFPGQSSLGIRSNGDVFLAAAFNGSVDMGGGPLQGGTWGLVLAKFDPSGAHLWSQAYPSEGATPISLALGLAGAPIIYGAFTGSLALGGAFAGPTYTTNHAFDLFFGSFPAPP